MFLADVIVVLCHSGSHSAATTEQCGAGGEEMEREGLSVRAGITTGEWSFSLSRSIT